ncbi:retrovirus-related pol polyprotein from transposon TNT 1-94 [Tanacetum coccineum]
MIQICLNATVRNIKTDNGTEFVNQALRAYYAEVRISNQTSVARSSQQNGVVERWNCTLVEAARTMLIFSKAFEDLVDTMASEQFSSAPEPKLMTPGTISLGLVQNIPSPTPHCPITCYSTSTSSSTIIDQDAPPTSTSQTTQETASMKE